MNINKPKIAIVSIKNSYKHGGVLATLKIVYDFCEQYFDPTVFVLGFDKSISAHLRPLKLTSTRRTIDYCGMKTVEIGSRWAFWEPGHYDFTKKQWEKALDGYDYVFVVSATPIAGHPITLVKKKFVLWASTPYHADRTERVKRLKGIRKVINQLSKKRMEQIEQKVLYEASYILPLSSYSKQQFEKLLGNKDKKMAICGYPIKVSDKCLVKRGPHTIIAVGRFSDPRKNITMLMRVFDHLSIMYPSVRLTIVGQQPPMELLARFARHEWFDKIHFTGPIDQAALQNVYDQASLMLITSYQEGFGIAGLEALAHGLPIISTDCGGVRDYILHEKTGYLVSVDDAKDMAMKACSLLMDQEKYRDFSAAGKMHAQTLFSYERVYSLFKQSLISVYPALKTLFGNSYERLDHQSYLHSTHQQR